MNEPCVLHSQGETASLSTGIIMADPKVADLTEDKIKNIQDLEKQLGDNICLIAIEKFGELYVLEAKIAPNLWERADRVYPEIKDLRAYYTAHEDAHITKSSLKKLLNSPVKKALLKRPLRIRRVDAAEVSYLPKKQIEKI